MWCWIRRCAAILCGGLVVAVAGCGFQLAGSATHLPAAMRATYIASTQPYGGLENLLRRAILADGLRVVEDPGQATATLDIMSAGESRRVLAVNSRGQPQEYEIRYTVQYQVVDRLGHVLLQPSTIKLARDLAYSVGIELGASRRQQQLLESMQREASRLILLRLQALGKAHPAAAATATPKSNV